MPSGPRASAGAEIRAVVTPRQIAARQGRSRRLNAGIAPVMFDLSPEKRIKISSPQCARTGLRRKHPGSTVWLIVRL
jgi:hypothetical protein